MSLSNQEDLFARQEKEHQEHVRQNKLKATRDQNLPQSKKETESESAQGLNLSLNQTLSSLILVLEERGLKAVLAHDIHHVFSALDNAKRLRYHLKQLGIDNI